MRPLLILVFIFAVILAAAGCSDDPVKPQETFRVYGVVNAYIMDPSYGLNHYMNPAYTVQTGREATVVATSLDAVYDHDFTVRTDEQSRWLLDLPAGEWKLTVSTDHTFPVTFDSIPVCRDTSFGLNLIYDFADPDTFFIGFHYGPGTAMPPDVYDVETGLIETLNERTGSMLCAGCAVETSQYDSLTEVRSHLYAVPKRTKYKMWEIVTAMRLELGNPDYPSYMSAGPRGYGLNPDDFSWADSLGRP